VGGSRSAHPPVYLQKLAPAVAVRYSQYSLNCRDIAYNDLLSTGAGAGDGVGRFCGPVSGHPGLASGEYIGLLSDHRGYCGPIMPTQENQTTIEVGTNCTV